MLNQGEPRSSGDSFIVLGALLAVSSDWNVLMLLSIPALVILNGLFVAAEFALVSVRKTRVEEMVRKGVKGPRRWRGRSSAWTAPSPPRSSA